MAEIDEVSRSVRSEDIQHSLSSTTCLASWNLWHPNKNNDPRNLQSLLVLVYIKLIVYRSLSWLSNVFGVFLRVAFTTEVSTFEVNAAWAVPLAAGRPRRTLAVAGRLATDGAWLAGRLASVSSAERRKEGVF